MDLCPVVRIVVSGATIGMGSFISSVPSRPCADSYICTYILIDESYGYAADEQLDNYFSFADPLYGIVP